MIQALSPHGSKDSRVLAFIRLRETRTRSHPEALMRGFVLMHTFSGHNFKEKTMQKPLGNFRITEYI